MSKAYKDEEIVIREGSQDSDHLLAVIDTIQKHSRNVNGDICGPGSGTLPVRENNSRKPPFPRVIPPASYHWRNCAALPAMDLSIIPCPARITPLKHGSMNIAYLIAAAAFHTWRARKASKVTSIPWIFRRLSGRTGNKGQTVSRNTQ